ncbi:MAG: dTMP kinase [Bacteriovoracaceae bacterium]|jgi:dTMP kinase|nr:dTMP kinase [Bacteriovoracaceae bacterium]
MKNTIPQELIQKFRSPEFPGSFFISFEGIEGAGKSTQIARLKDYLEKKNFRVLILREPGGTFFGERLREAILNAKTELHPLAEAHLFASSRTQLLSEVTLKELNIPNTVVIYDRYIDSSLAYQGVARGLGAREILEIHGQFPLTLVPHLTFYLKISPETSEKRQKMRNAPKDYFESRGMKFYESLVEGYDLASSLFKERILTLNAEQTLDNVELEIQDAINQLISKRPTNWNSDLET